MLQFGKQNKTKKGKKQPRDFLSIRVSFFHSAMESSDLSRGQQRREGLQDLVSGSAQFLLKELSLLSLLNQPADEHF